MEIKQITDEQIQQLMSWLRCYPVVGMEYTQRRLMEMLKTLPEVGK